MSPLRVLVQEIGQFVLDELDSLKDFVLRPSTGNHHLSATEYQAHYPRVVQSVNQTGELLGLVLHFVERQVESEVVEIELPW